MKLIGRKGIPTDVFEGNPAISNDKLILVDGRFKRGNYSYATEKWFWIEEFKCIIEGLEGDDELIWFDIENSKQ
jgi:hypothetical protein